MNGLFWYLRGYYRMLIVGTGIDRLLNRLGKERIPFWNLQWVDDYTLSICIFVKDETYLQHLSEAMAFEIREKRYAGTKEAIKRLLHRPMLLLGILLPLLAIMICQNYLLFFNVSGTEHISASEILRALEQIEIDVGTFGADISPKWIKDHMLSLMPSLQWITVTQNGCKANVVVRERLDTPEISHRKGFANIVAAKPAMITQQSVYEGQKLKENGDFVLEGELLVSGVVDLEKKYTIVQAQAEIYGKTWYNKSIIMPEICLSKEQNGRSSRCVWIEIGKRRIKILGNSRIYDADCDKMISRKNMTLPGGYVLPVSLLVERYCSYETETLATANAAAQEYLWNYAKRSVSSALCAGEILNCTGSVVCTDGSYRLKAVFTCHEMIAQTVKGKWNEEDFFHD